MADGRLESTWPQLLYAKRTPSPVRPVLRVTLGGIQKAYRDGFVLEQKIKHADLVSH